MTYIKPGPAIEGLRAICEAYDLPIAVRSALEQHLRLTITATVEYCAKVADDAWAHRVANASSSIRALNRDFGV